MVLTGVNIQNLVRNRKAAADRVFPVQVFHRVFEVLHVAFDRVNLALYLRLFRFKCCLLFRGSIGAGSE